MKSKDKKDASPKAARVDTATPFFARYLEGQEADAEAKVSEGKNQSNFTYKEGARGSKKGGAKAVNKASTKVSTAGKVGQKTAKIPVQTLKYPSDRDEWIFYPYHVEAATITAGRRQTLKYPSDNDEGDPYYAVYADVKDAPKEGAKAAAKPKEASMRLTRKKPKG